MQDKIFNKSEVPPSQLEMELLKFKIEEAKIKQEYQRLQLRLAEIQAATATTPIQKLSTFVRSL
jgi:hypothetical protein